MSMMYQHFMHWRIRIFRQTSIRSATHARAIFIYIHIYIYIYKILEKYLSAQGVEKLLGRA